MICSWYSTSRVPRNAFGAVSPLYKLDESVKIKGGIYTNGAPLTEQFLRKHREFSDAPGPKTRIGLPDKAPTPKPAMKRPIVN